MKLHFSRKILYLKSRLYIKSRFVKSRLYYMLRIFWMEIKNELTFSTCYIAVSVCLCMGVDGKKSSFFDVELTPLTHICSVLKLIIIISALAALFTPLNFDLIASKIIFCWFIMSMHAILSLSLCIYLSLRVLKQFLFPLSHVHTHTLISVDWINGTTSTRREAHFYQQQLNAS